MKELTVSQCFEKLQCNIENISSAIFNTIGKKSKAKEKLKSNKQVGTDLNAVF